MKNQAGEPCDLQEILWDYWSPYTMENADFATQEELEAGKHQSLEFARLFLRETDLDPWEVEYKFSLPVVDLNTGETLPDVELVGIIDILDRLGGRNRAVEIKTKSRKPDDFGAQTSIELTCYAYWLRFLDDQGVVPVSYANIIKNKKPYIHWQNQERGAGDFVDLYHTIKMVARNIQDGRFYRNPGVHCNWCDYKPVCSHDQEAVKEIFGRESLESLREVQVI